MMMIVGIVVDDSVSVSRSREVPLFGPPIPAGAKFPRNKEFVEFLLAKVINAENATYRSEKFTTMATRTRQEYLKDLVKNYSTNTPIDPRPKFCKLKNGHYYLYTELKGNSLIEETLFNY
jgi:signal-induced proliferation-associated 1 like protein 1